MRARFGEPIVFAGTEQKTFFNDILSAYAGRIVINLYRKRKVMVGTAANCLMVGAKRGSPHQSWSVP